MEEKFILENKVRLARVEKGWTQAELAKHAGVSRQTIISIESLKYNPSVTLAFILAKCLDKDINDIFIMHGPFNGQIKEVKKNEDI